VERAVILGAGFGGLELATSLSETLGDEVDVALIDENDAFVFGYSKLDVMFGRTTLDAGLFAIDIPPTASFTRLRQALQAHADRGDWDIDEANVARTHQAE